MAPDQRDRAYLWDMLDAALAVQDFVAGKKFEDYVLDRMLRGAVERHLEIIGEAARRVSEEFKLTHPEIPWRGIIGQRNILAHEYGEVNNERVWQVAVSYLPELISQIRTLLPEPA